MKGQAEEAGNTITNYPADGIVNFLMPMDADSGADPDTPAVSITNTEVLSGITYDIPFGQNDSAGTTTLSSGGTNTALANTKVTGSANMVFFFIQNTLAAGGVGVKIGDTGASGYINLKAGSGTNNYEDSDGAVAAPSFYFTASQSDQLIVIIMDRTNGLLKFYEGTNGDELVGTVDINSSATFDWAGIVTLPSGTITDGYGALRFDGNLPALVTIQAMLLDIATEMRSGTTFPDSVRYNWINNIVAKHLL